MTDFQTVIEAIDSAPFAEGGVETALALSARECGGWVAQLLGITDRMEIHWNWQSGLAPEASAEFERRMGDAPYINPRAGVVTAAAMRLHTDADFIDPDLSRRNAFYREFYEPLSVDHCGIVRLAARHGEANAVLAVLRSTAQGAMDAADLERMAVLAGRWNGAVRAIRTLEGQAANLTAATLDGLARPAIVLNRAGRIVAFSAAGEAVLAAGAPLRRTRAGGLAAYDARDAVAFDRAVGSVLSGAEAAPAPVVLHGPEGPAVAQVIGLPRARFDTGQGPAAVVVLTAPARPATQAADLIRRAYGLTPAESEIAAELLTGRAPAAVARRRGVRAQTLRNQLKSIFAKVGVASQLELSAVLGRLVGRP